jgi:hypothetical protein
MKTATSINAKRRPFKKSPSGKPISSRVNNGLRFCTLILVMTLFTSGVGLCQGPWTFTQIDPNAPSGSTYMVGNLTNYGAVTFVRFEPSGAEKVFLGDGTINCLIANLSSGPGFNSLSSPTVERNNSSSSVAFQASLTTGGQGIYVGTCNGFPTLTTIVFQASGSVSNGAINDNGVVAYLETDALGNMSVWKGDGTNSLKIDSTTSVFVTLGIPGINNDYFGSSTNLPNSGTVSYFKARASGNGARVELDSDLTKTILTQTCGSISLANYYPTVINNDGLVAYSGFSSQGDSSICVQATNVPEQVIAYQPEGLLGGLGNFDVNIEGIVAFTDYIESFSDIQTQLDCCVTTGELGGNYVSYVFVGGINDNCQISFLAYYQDGGQGVWRAEPTTCPVQPCAPPTCSATQVAYQHGAVLASIGIDRRLPYGMLDEFLHSAWPMPLTDSQPLGTPGMTSNKSGDFQHTNSALTGGAVGNIAPSRSR